MKDDKMIVQIGDKRLLDPWPFWNDHEGALLCRICGKWVKGGYRNRRRQRYKVPGDRPWKLKPNEYAEVLFCPCHMSRLQKVSSAEVWGGRRPIHEDLQRI
jgi:hypothetical protein